MLKEVNRKWEGGNLGIGFKMAILILRYCLVWLFVLLVFKMADIVLS